MSDVTKLKSLIRDHRVFRDIEINARTLILTTFHTFNDRHDSKT